MNGGSMQSIKHHIKPSRRQFPLVLTLCVQISGLLFSGQLCAQNTWQSALVSMDTITGELSYTEEAVSGVRIADFSRAGYRGGGIPLPFVPVKLTISPINGDNTAHIQSAIDSVSTLPLDEQGFRGALLLNPGVYEVYGRLTLTTSGVILRGSGGEDDTLSNTHILGLGNTPADRTILEMGGLSNTRFAGQVAGTKTDIISPLVQVGDRHFRVANPDPYQVGDNIIIYHPCTAEWLAAINAGDTGSDAGWTVGSQPILYNTRIEKIKCDTIFTKSPVFNTLDNSLAQSYIYKYDRAGLVENVGIENLRIDIEYNQSNPNDENLARNAVKITQAENAWVRECTFLHFWYAGVDMQTVNYITVENCKALSPRGPTDGGRKYNFCVSQASQNCLITNCLATEGRHAFVSNGTSTVAGVVFHKCTSIDPFTSSEGHRRWTTGLLFDNMIDRGNNPGRVLALYNRGSYGTGHGWSSANSVAWNCDVTRPGTDGQICIQRPPTAQNFAIGCKGIITGNGPFSHPAGYIEGSNLTDSLIPHSLYEAQLVSRNYRDSLNRYAAIDFRMACDSFTWVDGITYYESTDFPEFTLTDGNGCDSLVVLQLIIYTVDDSVIQNGNTLTAQQPDATYQWVDCNNHFAPLPGENNQSFSPTENGSYAVVVSANNCVDTSSCYQINTVSWEQINDKMEIGEFYPNPSKPGRVSLASSFLKKEDLSFFVYDIAGRMVQHQSFTTVPGKNHLSLDCTSLQPGVYIVKLTTENQFLYRKLIMD